MAAPPSARGGAAITARGREHPSTVRALVRRVGEGPRTSQTAGKAPNSPPPFYQLK
ncbi:hypothetical protein WOLCODRAFT_155377 [Wolfiporia cocos MD-104 SS10]|uniref:Uncharacterized protein n=1 Tax=Wolfiporia cocos (strain MD-104) TaxID=742152 RepID=A0A2H3J7K9_WOLCO|nr:hypothetical protein WOLCODRAFT_155377 [Wolfiporia cocos MD-104 SS10]